MKKKRKPARIKKKPAFLSTRQGKIILISSAIIILLAFFLRGPRGTIELYKNTIKRNQLQEEIDQLKRTKTELDSEKVKLNDDQYIEKTAREQYNMKKQGEKVYKVKKDSN